MWDYYGAIPSHRNEGMSVNDANEETHNGYNENHSHTTTMRSNTPPSSKHRLEVISCPLCVNREGGSEYD